MSRYKYCIVPMCTNTTKKTPEKYFFNVPRDAVIRKRWCTSIKRDDSKVPPLSSNTARHVCQDHFDLENDTENHSQYSLVGGRMKLKQGIVPHIFECQKAKAVTSIAERAAKRQRKKTVSDLLEDCEAKEPEASDISPMEVDNSSYLLCNMKEGNNCEKGVQVNLKAPYRSKSTNTAIKTVDFSCQAQPGTSEEACCSSAVYSDESFSSDLELEIPDSQGSDTESQYSSDSVYEDEEGDEELKKRTRDCIIKSVQKKSFMCLGIPDDAKFLIEFLATKSKCSTTNIMITLKKIRMNETYENLGMLFGVSTSTVSHLFKKTLFSLAGVLQNFIVWPADSVAIKYCLPTAFRKRYFRVQSIIDCFEIPIQKPSNALHQSLSWSEYYKDNTVKYLISCTPDGTVSFISRGYGGRATDALIVEDSGYLDLLFPNLEVMADRGFKNIAVLLEWLKFLFKGYILLNNVANKAKFFKFIIFK